MNWRVTCSVQFFLPWGVGLPSLGICVCVFFLLRLANQGSRGGAQAPSRCCRDSASEVDPANYHVNPRETVHPSVSVFCYSPASVTTHSQTWTHSFCLAFLSRTFFWLDCSSAWLLCQRAGSCSGQRSKRTADWMARLWEITRGSIAFGTCLELSFSFFFIICGAYSADTVCRKTLGSLWQPIKIMPLWRERLMQHHL